MTEEKIEEMQLANFVTKFIALQSSLFEELYGTKKKNQLTDDFVLGYMYGATDAALQRRDIKEDVEAIATLMMVFGNILGPEMGSRLLGQVLRRLETHDKELEKYVRIGGLNFLEFLQELAGGEKAKLALAIYLYDDEITAK